MPFPSKIVDTAEVRNWILEGRTYQWMVDEYRRKYHVSVSRTMFSNFRKARALPPRQAPSLETFIPWRISPAHQSKGWDLHLHTAARMADGLPVKPADRSAFQSWWATMRLTDSVVAYEPDRGYYAVPRRPGIDGRYIREPAHQ